MDLRQIEQALHQKFEGEGQRIVFWNDPAGEFAQTLADLSLPGVTVLDLAQGGALEIKIQLERHDPEGRYLLYSATEEPEYQNDWLLDIRLYSGNFRADRASILLGELGLQRQQLRGHIARRRKFFDHKDRVRKLKALIDPTDDEAALDRKMIAVVAKADQTDPFSIVRTLLHALAATADRDAVPEAWEQIEKFDLDAPFWDLMASLFGYREERRSLRNLLIRLLVSDYLHHLRQEPPKALLHLQLPRSGTHNAVVFLAQWRDSSSTAGSYNALASEVATRLRLEDSFAPLEAEELLDVMTFVEVEKAIVRSLLARVTPTAEGIDAAASRRMASHRQAGHWVSSVSVPEKQRGAREAVYEAIAVAAQLFELRHRYQDGFAFPDAAALYRAYAQELFQFDQLHRHFCWHADRAAAQGWDVLKPLRQDVEAYYRNVYLAELSLAWGKFVDTGLLETWRVQGVPNQFEFYDKHIGNRLAESDRRRVFVIVSDALRYEVAEELTGLLKGTYRIEAELTSQLGVLPSHTSLGMASLLPHEQLAYNPKGKIQIDGQDCSSLARRQAILAGVEGMAVRAGELMALKKEEGRERVRDHRVVYIYHNGIDAVGDQAATEANTFDAVRKTLNDLLDLVRYIINHLNGNSVVVTADHGFLFTETAPNETDKSQLLEKPPGTVMAKKRYLLGRDLPSHPDVWRGRTAVTAGAEGEMEFWLPKGANLFHFTGGARFVHGGAMLQEIVVPIITVKHLKHEKVREGTRTRPVPVQVLGNQHRITAPKHRFQLIQMEAVGDRAKPITLKVAVYQGDEPVTSIETVTFESASDKMEERQRWVVLTLENRPFDKNTPYRLVLRDSETDIEMGSVDVIIDRAIHDDFDF